MFQSTLPPTARQGPCQWSEKWCGMSRITQAKDFPGCNIKKQRFLSSGEVKPQSLICSEPPSARLDLHLKACELSSQSPHFYSNKASCKYSIAWHVADLYLKWSWLFYFVTLMEVHLERGGAAWAFAIHIPSHDYIKSVFCHIWLMYLVFLKTGLKYENRQKWGHYKELSIFNNLLKKGKMKWRIQRSCSEIQ